MVIIGLSQEVSGHRQIFEEADGGTTVSRSVDQINAYLVPAKETIVEPLRKHISALPELDRGNSPTDGGHLLLTRNELDELGLSSIQRKRFIRPFSGSMELIRGVQRYCIWIEDSDVKEASEITPFAKRIEAVRQFRLESSKSATVTAAKWAHRFDERKALPVTPIICVPVTSSENREYLPVGLLPPGTAISNSSFGMPVKDLWVLAIIASKMNLVWVATVCSRMRTDYRFTNTLAWNTFPVPTLTDHNKADLTRCAEDILLTREAHFPATIADLYDPEAMPADLRAAHERNDEVLERIYIGRKFRNDTERLEKLFELYTKLTSKGKAA